VLALLVKGLRNPEIAGAYVLAYTVKVQVSSILSKLKVSMGGRSRWRSKQVSQISTHGLKLLRTIHPQVPGPEISAIKQC
jgi:DNA-binding NarL/FixJ family response regulator